MRNFDWKQGEAVLSLELAKTSATTFYLCWKNKVSQKVYGEADLVIKEAPSYFDKTLDRNDQLVLICHNVRFYCEEDLKGFPPKLIIKGISKTLGELLALSIKRRLAGVLLILAGTEVAYLTEAQKHWVKDFCDLFTVTTKTSEEGLHQLYMPATHGTYKHYLELDLLLEKDILANSLKI